MSRAVVAALLAVLLVSACGSDDGLSTWGRGQNEEAAPFDSSEWVVIRTGVVDSGTSWQLAEIRDRDGVRCQRLLVYRRGDEHPESAKSKSRGEADCSGTRTLGRQPEEAARLLADGAPWRAAGDR